MEDIFVIKKTSAKDLQPISSSNQEIKNNARRSMVKRRRNRETRPKNKIMLQRRRTTRARKHSFALCLGSQNCVTACFHTINLCSFHALFLNWNPTYLHVAWIFLAAAGISSYWIDDTNKNRVFAKKVPCMFLNSFAFLDTLILLKQVLKILVYARDTSDIGIYIFVMEILTKLIIRMTFIWFLQRGPEKVCSLLDTVDNTGWLNALKDKKKSFLAVIVCWSGLFCAVSKSFSGIIVGGWENFLETNADKITDLFTWPNLGKQSSSKENKLEGTMFTAAGTVGIISTLAGNMVEYAAFDCAILAILVLYQVAKKFESLKIYSNVTGDSYIVLKKDSEEMKKCYNDLKSVSESFNNTFFPFTKFILLGNLFFSASFLDTSLNAHATRIERMFLLMQLLMTCAIYFFANEISKVGDRFKDWLVKDGNQIKINMSEYAVLKEQLAPGLVGVGKGNALINEGFLISYVGAAVAYFFGIVETRARTSNAGK